MPYGQSFKLFLCSTPKLGTCLTERYPWVIFPDTAEGMVNDITYVWHGVPDHGPTGHDEDAGQPFMVRESRVHGQGATLRKTCQNRLDGRHLGRRYLLIDHVMQLVHRPQDAGLVFHHVLVQRRQVKPGGRRKSLVQRQRDFRPANVTQAQYIFFFPRK